MLRFLLLILFIHFSVELLAQESDNVPFAIIEQAPIYPGCEDLDKQTQKKCLQNGITHHIGKKFNTGMVDTLGLEPGIVRVYVQFRINEKGLVDSISARGTHKRLEHEAIRVVGLLPKIKPALDKDNNPVAVKYTLPINLYVEAPKKKKKRGL
jgi:protein TonB